MTAMAILPDDAVPWITTHQGPKKNLRKWCTRCVHHGSKKGLMLFGACTVVALFSGMLGSVLTASALGAHKRTQLDATCMREDMQKKTLIYSYVHNDAQQRQQTHYEVRSTSSRARSQASDSCR